MSKLKNIVGSLFAERTARNHAVLAAAPNTSPAFIRDSQVGKGGQLTHHIPPFGLNPPRETVGTIPTALAERYIHNDPRELWYLALPNKISPQQCVSILRSALGGDLWQQWQLLSLMLDTWPTFRIAAHQLREAASYVKYKVHVEGGDDASKINKEKGKLVERAMKNFCPNQFNDEKGFTGMVYDLTDSLLNGLSMVELIWEDRNSKEFGRETMPRAAAWVHPRAFTFKNDGFIAVFDDNYNRLYANPQINGKVGTDPDPNKFILGQFISRSGSSLGAGFMRPLVWYWAARQFNSEWMLNHARQYGSPFIDITYNPETTSAQEKLDLEAMLASAGPQRRLLHKTGTAAIIHPASSMGADNPQRWLAKEADEAALFLLLGQTGTTTAVPGSLGNQDTHMSVKQERVEGLAQWTAKNPLRHWARAVINVNYGNSDNTPELLPDFTKPLSVVEVAQMLSGLRSSGLPVRADQVYEKAGWTQPQKEELVYRDGQLLYMAEPVDEQEIRDQQQAQQEAEQAAMANGNQNGPSQPIQGSSPAVKTLAAALSRMGKKETGELDSLVKAAEGATHRNGEWTRLQSRLKEIGITLT